MHALSSNVVSFVDTRYTEAGTPARVRAIFASVRHIEPLALPLRTGVHDARTRRARRSAVVSLIPHIVRKDWKLLWPLVVAGAALQALLAFLEYRPESFAAGGGSNAAATILSLSLESL